MVNSNNEKIKQILLRNRNTSLIFYTLSQTPSYIMELSTALLLPESEVKNIIWFLRNNKLIRELQTNRRLRNGAVREFYPILLKKQKNAIRGLTNKEAHEVLRNIKFYFISVKGFEFLPYAQKRIFNNGGDKNV